MAAGTTRGEMENGARARMLGYAACAAAGVLWSTGFLFGKIALRSMDSSSMVLYRFLFACVTLLPMVRRPSFRPREWALLLAASLLGVPLQFLTQFYGLSLTTVSHAALMVGTLPGMLALGAAVFTRERLPARGWLALAGSSCGVVLIVLSSHTHAGGHGPSLRGDLFVLVSMVISIGWLLLNKALLREHSPLQVTVWGLLSGTAMLVAWVLSADLRTHQLPPVAGVPAMAWLALAASGLLCTTTTTLLWNWGIRRVPASRAGVFLNIEPALGSLLGVWLLGDQLGPMAWLGGALIVIAAVVLTTAAHLEIGTVQPD